MARRRESIKVRYLGIKTKSLRQLKREIHVGGSCYEELSWYQKVRWLSSELVENQYCKITVTVLIILNSVLFGLATWHQHVRKSSSLLLVIDIVTTISLILITTESVLQFIYRGYAMFNHGWLVFDLIVLSVAWLVESLALAIPKCKALQITIGFMLITRLPPLRRVVLKVMSVWREIYSVLLFLLLILYIFAVYFTLAFRNLDPDLEVLFGTFFRSFLTCTQMMTLDEWSIICRSLIDYVPWAWVPMISFIWIIHYTFYNLMIGVLCYAVSKNTSSRDSEQMTKTKSLLLKDLSSVKLNRHCIFDVMNTAVETQKEAQKKGGDLIAALNEDSYRKKSQKELESISIALMNQNHENEISSTRSMLEILSSSSSSSTVAQSNGNQSATLSDSIHSASLSLGAVIKDVDAVVRSVFIHDTVKINSAWAVVSHPWFRCCIIMFLVLDTVVLCLSSYDFIQQNIKLERVLRYISLTMHIIFTIEVILQVIYYRMKFFKDKLLLFDASIVAISWWQETFLLLKLLTALRWIRYVKAIKFLTKFNAYFKAVRHVVVLACYNVMPVLWPLAIILAFVLYIFGVLFTELYGSSSYYFSSLFQSLFTCMEMMTLEWADVARDLDGGDAGWSTTPIIIYIIISQYILFNMLIAVISNAVDLVDEHYVSLLAQKAVLRRELISIRCQNHKLSKTLDIIIMRQKETQLLLVEYHDLFVDMIHQNRQKPDIHSEIL